MEAFILIMDGILSEVLRTFFVMKTSKISHIPAGFMPKVWTILIWLTLFCKRKFVLSVIHAMNSLSSNWTDFVYPITWSIRASRRSTSRGLPTRKGREVKSSKDGEDEGFCMSSERELWRCKRELVKKRRLLFSWESRGNNEQMLRLKETGVRLWSSYAWLFVPDLNLMPRPFQDIFFLPSRDFIS